MAEVQTTTESGAMTQQFIEFVMMQAQNAAHFLGQIPGPNGPAEVNPELAKMFIDQLVMIREKTRGNLSTDESGVLNSAIANLQMTFVDVVQGGGPGEPMPERIAPPAAAVEPEAPAVETSADSRKKFTKSYGA